VINVIQQLERNYWAFNGDQVEGGGPFIILAKSIKQRQLQVARNGPIGPAPEAE
jgi:hypothetical protein